MKTAYQTRLGRLIQRARQRRNMTQTQLAKELNTSQSAINRIESGGQNVSLEMLARISEVLKSEIVSLNTTGSMNLRITGGKKLHGEIAVRTSKNAAVALLCASLLNKGTTTLRRVAKIEEVMRIIEVLQSIGVKVRWLENNDLEITPPTKLKLKDMDVAAAKRTRTVIMFLGPLLHDYHSFQLPYAGGCNLGTRTVEPHLVGLKHFGLEVIAKDEKYEVKSKPQAAKKPIVLIERGETTTENIIMAAARSPHTTIIRNASHNYMVQDLCFYLEKLGVKIEGVGTSELKITGLKSIDKNVEYWPSEDPIEAMSLIAAAIVTKSQLTITRVPREFTEIELAVLETMGLHYDITRPYLANNQRTELIDVTIHPSRLKAAKDKLHAMPYPGVNADNLPFLALIAATAEGRSLVHDWMYENRAIYLTELTKLNARVELLDAHRVYISGPTHWRSSDLMSPEALRPSVVILLAMMAADGISTLRNVYNINRGYEDLFNRLNAIGAEIEVYRDI